MATPVPAVERASRILELLAAEPAARHRLSAIAQRLEIHKATCAAILAELAAAELVSRHPDGPSWSLGPRLVALGAASAGQHRGFAEARHEMQTLARELELGCFVTAPLGEEMVVLDRSAEPALADLAATIPIGLRAPLRPPLGTIFFAWAPDAEVERWLAQGDESDEDRERLRRALHAVRLRGWSLGSRVELQLPLDAVLDRLAQADEPAQRVAIAMELAELVRREHEDPAHVVDDAAGRGAQLLLAPVFGPGGRVVLSLTLFGRPSRFGPRDVPRYAAALVAAARRVTGAIGGHEPVEATGWR
ncbi:MAG TPA: helix-turn-helix domain-containing protein [Conexibacter sp.]|nr:helix-turn-helix domain-containing protein [Conexibacter sp.]